MFIGRLSAKVGIGENEFVEASLLHLTMPSFLKLLGGMFIKSQAVLKQFIYIIHQKIISNYQFKYERTTKWCRLPRRGTKTRYRKDNLTQTTRKWRTFPCSCDLSQQANKCSATHTRLPESTWIPEKSTLFGWHVRCWFKYGIKGSGTVLWAYWTNKSAVSYAWCSAIWSKSKW